MTAANRDIPANGALKAPAQAVYGKMEEKKPAKGIAGFLKRVK